MRKLHKWLGLLLAVQMLIWIFSGAVISLVNMEEARGGVFRAGHEEAPALSGQGDLVAIAQIELPDKPVLSLQLHSLLGQPVYRIGTASGLLMIDARTGRTLEIDEALATRLGKASYRGSGQLLGLEYLPEGSPEVRGAPGALWRMDFDDRLDTRVYISALDGRVLAHRNSRWQLVDFLLMLHFMDYTREDSFNNPQIIVLAFGALWLAITGMLLTLRALCKGQLH